MQDAKSVSTPLAAHFKLSSQLCPSSDDEMKCMSEVPYTNAVGCLVYLMMCTRPDISHAISVVYIYGKFRERALECSEVDFRYLVGTRAFEVMFDKEVASASVMGYVDADYAGDLDSRRSTTSFVFYVCWWPYMLEVYSTRHDCFIYHRGRVYGGYRASERSGLA